MPLRSCQVPTFSSTLYTSESIWPPPFSTGVYRNEEPSPEGQRDKEIPLSQFILSLFEGVGQLLPGDFAGLLMCRPRLLAAGDSCCQKVLQSFSGSIQGVRLQGKNYLACINSMCFIIIFVSVILKYKSHKQKWLWYKKYQNRAKCV